VTDPEARKPFPEGEALEDLAETARARFHTSEDVAATFIRDAIGRGIFRPGDHLNQGRIGDLLGMSRIPVRSSLRQLEAQRLVTINRFRGARVSELAIEDVNEIYELRAAVECMTLDHVARNLTPEISADLKFQAATLDEATEIKVRWVEARQTFYDQLFGISGQTRMTELVSDLRMEVAGYVAIHDVTRAHAGHLQLVEMLERGDVEEAKEWHRQHILGVRDRLIAAMEAEPPVKSAAG
jgi:DNA-binding GntR family transcriptional regulator